MNTALLITYVLTIVLFLGTPGPVTVLVVNASIKDGFLAGLKSVIGTNMASLVLIALSFVVIQGVFSVSETALNWLTLLGSLYLLYFAIGILREKTNAQSEQADNTQSANTHYQTIQNFDNNTNSKLNINPAKSTKNHLKNGFLIGISNPKDVLFFIAFFPMFLKVYESSIHISMLILIMVWVVLDYAILSVYALLFSKIKNDKLAYGVSRFSGVVLLLVAIYAIVKIIQVLFG